MNNNISALQKILYEKLHRRPAGIDKLDRLWEAAVLVPLVQTNEGIAILFEQRAQSLRSQPGEICFPGGKVDCSDLGFANTAVRETCEELGVKTSDITLCGALDILVTHTGPIIHPYVGFLKRYDDMSYNKSEVERIFTVPLKELLEIQPQRCTMQLADHPGDDFPYDLVPQRIRGWRKNKDYYVYFYHYKDYIIWGLTARILYAFLRRSRKELNSYLTKFEYEEV